MNIQDAKKVLKIAREADDTVIMQGLHGIGKSAVVKQYCLENEYFLTELFLSNQEVGDLIGYPETIDGVQYWSVPVWLHRMYEANKQGKHCVLHLDELNRADPDVLQAALQLVLEGKIHEHSLPVLDNKRTHIIASINPPDSDYSVHELDPALLDRFLFIEVKAHLPTFLNYGELNNLHDSIIEFLKENPKYLHFTEDSSEIGSTPRSWMKLSNYIHLHDSSNIDKHIILKLITGKVGNIPGTEFYVFLNSSGVKLKDITDFIDKNSSVYDNIEEFAANVPKLESPIKRTEAALTINDPFTLLVYLYSIEQEILITSLKNLKDKPIFKDLVKIDESLNNKGLFKRATSASL